MRVLSLFDGMRCGHLALDRANIHVDEYYASEVDKFAIKVATTNYPNGVDLGDVRDIDIGTLDEVDLLLGGSPCQNFSFAGKRNGMTTQCKEEVLTLDRYLELKKEGFTFEGQSYLFWEYIRVLREIQEINPAALFLLENVVMSKKWEDIISNTLGVSPTKINSLLVVPQNRVRLYWTNINNGNIPQPENISKELKALLKVAPSNGLLTEGRGRWLASDKGKSTINKAYAKVLSSSDDRYVNCLTTRSDASWNSNYIVDYYPHAEVKPYHKTNYELMVGSGIVKPFDSTTCVTNVNSSSFKQGVVRKLTPVEYEILQTVPKGYTNMVSPSQRYKMLGNGWTIDVIAHILSFIK